MREIFHIGILLILAFGLGWLSCEAYDVFFSDDLHSGKIASGLYVYEAENYKEAQKIADDVDKNGDWVCINVAYDMPMDLAYETCVHECSHKAFTEIFAEKCEKNATKCLEMLK